MSPQRPVQFTLRFTSRLDSARTIVLEPWTGEYRLGPGEQLDIAVEGTPSTPLAVELEGDRIIVFAFDSTGAMLTARRDGKELPSDYTPPAG